MRRWGLGRVVVQLGMIGSSPGNGHPYSFSAIFNGYDSGLTRSAGWDVVANYLEKRPAKDFGIDGFSVSHVWSSIEGESERIAAAARIPTVAHSLEDMAESVDAVLIARDDPESHAVLAQPFLDAGLPVLIDKPLTVDAAELDHFRRYLESGQLFSSSSMRFSPELNGLATSGNSLVVSASGPKDWRRYGVHLVEGVLPHIDVGRPVAIRRHFGGHESFSVETSSGTVLHFDACGDAPVGFQFHRISSDGATSARITDNFSMFKRMLEAFCRQITSAQPAIDPADTTEAIELVIAGHKCDPGEVVRLG